LLGIPWRVAFALQADGWYLRQEIIWAKPNPMPESVRDRFTKSHEQIFLFSKSPRYFFDQEAVKEPATCFRQRGSGPMVAAGTGRNDAETGTRGDYRNRPSVAQGGFEGKGATPGTGQPALRNKRDVWTVATRSFKGAHFATFPPDLIEPCILAGCPAACCSRCGAPRVAIVERSPMVIARTARADKMGATGRTQASGTMTAPATSRVVGYKASCDCSAPDAPGTVFDPFGGSGTTAMVALRLGRRAVLCELNPEYIEIAHARIAGGK
jgi:hypothetical protein